MTDDEDAKKRVYRRYCRGDATVDDVTEVLGGTEAFEDRRDFINLIEDTATVDAQDDLFC